MYPLAGLIILLLLLYPATENSFEKLVADFQLGLFHHYAENKEPLYNPAIMRDFAEENALGLIDIILQSILR